MGIEYHGKKGTKINFTIPEKQGEETAGGDVRLYYRKKPSEGWP